MPRIENLGLFQGFGPKWLGDPGLLETLGLVHLDQRILISIRPD